MSDRATPYTDAEYIKWVHLPMNDQLTNMHLHARRLECELTQAQKQLNHTFEELTETRTQRDRLAEALERVNECLSNAEDVMHGAGSDDVSRARRVISDTLAAAKGGSHE
jgi:septal ring factor EnvC (AmiA/AmiB activator)